MSRLLLLVAFCLSLGIITAQNDAVCVSGELDLVFIIDASNSIGWGNFLRLKNFLRGFITHLSIDNGAVKVGAVVYSTTVEIEFHLDSYTTAADIDKHLSKIKYTDGVTYTAGALNVTKNVLFTAAKGDREDIPNFVILVTDGNSNYRKDLTIPYADNLKEVAVIYALGIGKELEEYPQELLEIVRQPELGNADMYQMLKDYQALEELKNAIFDNMCPIIQQNTVIQNGSPCYEEGKVFEKRCRTFKCINSKWKKMGFTGCINNGKCFEWGEKRSDICYQYKCSKPAGCKNNLCPSYNYRLVNAGCIVDGQCVDENKIVEDTNVCANYQCIRRTFDNNEVYSEYLMVGKECVRSDGTCSEVGYTYKEHCISYECQASTFNGILTAEFIPVNTACKYGNKCVQLGERVTEVCDVLVCNYDDKAMGYELMLESQGCEHNGQCLMKNQKVFEESTCTNFVCSYSKRQNRLVMKERVAGCKGTDGSCAAKGDVVTQKGCIKYQCDNKGNLELIEAGCDVGGECKPVGSKWRQPGECAVFRCVLVDTMDDTVETDIEQDLGLYILYLYNFK
ncbi:von Willebrand factor A domain-containing protein 2-like [Mytilus trossulus]|uniref:von Willebrand factor A domain-containing protein 2-like n=1 Tax=Mytilus trossulus TaxID=6551 RepID=UPI0030052D9D